jgi:two-component system, cell cycle response regulator
MSNHNELLASHRVLSMLESACEYSEQVLDKVPSVFVVLNHQNQIIRANHAFCRAVGLSMQAALHQDFTALFGSEHRALLLRHVEQVRRSALPEAKASVQLELVPLSESEASKPFFWRIFRQEHLSDADGPVISLLGDDLSALYAQELKLMSIFSSIPLGLLVMDRHGQITEVLSEYCQVLLDQTEPLGKALPQLLAHHNRELGKEIALAFEALHGSAGHTLTHFNSIESSLSALGCLRIQQHSGAERWIKPRFQPIAKNEVVDRFLVIIEDITASQQAQKQIEQADLLGKQAQALYECAIRDPLSGLYTRLFMNDSINPLIASAKRGNFDELAIVMFDIDNFKSVNDTHGHDAGDRVIKAIGQVILACIRDTDIAVRFGGEEFLLALPCNDSHEQGGSIVAERIRAKLAATPIDIGAGQQLQVTTSCGVAYCHTDDDLSSLIQRADHHLYMAKHSGKNRVCVETKKGA